MRDYSEIIDRMTQAIAAGDEEPLSLDGAVAEAEVEVPPGEIAAEEAVDPAGVPVVEEAEGAEPATVPDVAEPVEVEEAALPSVEPESGTADLDVPPVSAESPEDTIDPVAVPAVEYRDAVDVGEPPVAVEGQVVEPAGLPELPEVPQLEEVRVGVDDPHELSLANPPLAADAVEVHPAELEVPEPFPEFSRPAISWNEDDEDQSMFWSDQTSTDMNRYSLMDQMEQRLSEQEHEFQRRLDEMMRTMQSRMEDWVQAMERRHRL
jgi:hypothetical protein